MMIESPIRAPAWLIAPHSTSPAELLGVEGQVEELQQAAGVLGDDPGRDGSERGLLVMLCGRETASSITCLPAGECSNAKSQMLFWRFPHRPQQPTASLHAGSRFTSAGSGTTLA
jgi:hypothetical protein